GWCAGRTGGGNGLSEDAAEHDQQVDAAAVGLARDRRIRAQRRPYGPARFFRGGRAIYYAGHVARTLPGWIAREGRRKQGDPGIGHQSREAKPGNFVRERRLRQITAPGLSSIVLLSVGGTSLVQKLSITE